MMPSHWLKATDTDQCEPIGYMGRSLTGFYLQIRALVIREIGQEATCLFAEPSSSEEGNEADWFVESDETPISFVEAGKQEQTKARETLNRWLEQLRGVAAENQNSSGTIFNVLEQVVDDPADIDLYIVGGRPVITNWGYRQKEGYVGQKTRPVDPEPEEPEPIHDVSGGKTSTKIRRYPDALTVVALLSVVLAIFSGLLGSGIAEVVGNPFSSVDGKIAGQLTDLQRSNSTLRNEVDSLNTEYANKVLGCANSCAADATSGTDNGPTAKKEAPKPPEVKKEDLPELKIPDEAVKNKDVSFMEGTWRSFQDQLTLGDEREPVDIEYVIKKDGTGIRKVYKENGEVCEGKIRAYFDSEGLAIKEEEPAMCSDHKGVRDYTVRCETLPAGKAKCSMKPNNSTNNEEITVDLRRLK